MVCLKRAGDLYYETGTSILLVLPPMYVVAAFYQFAPLPDYADHQDPLRALASKHGLTGTVLLATEGINGTIAGSQAGIDAMLAALRQLPGCEGLEHKESSADECPFKKMKVRLKKEIVTMGVPVDPASDAGTYVDPHDWNDLISDPDVTLVDARNAYEIEIGAFQGAVDPKTESFGEFPAWIDDHARTTEKKKLAMYCTGGIRCEKATAYAKDLGFEEVYHLKGGILKYLETVPQEQSKWDGECYVFDRRVSVLHGLEQGQYRLCGGCGMPINDEDEAHKDFEQGVSCAKCIDLYTEKDRKRFRQRQRQSELARKKSPA